MLGLVRNPNMRKLGLLCLAVAAFGAALYKATHWPEKAAFQMPVISQKPASPVAEFHTGFVSTQQNIATHAASLVELGDGRIRAFWFAGSYEGAEDVEIRSAVFDPVKGSWSQEYSVANRKDTQRALLRYVKRLGNPVALRAPDGKLWLFYVTVSLGGWAGSSITVITSTDDGATWSPARRLITSPFINISTLDKGTPFLYDDGTIGLPVYHEFIGQFCQLLRISRDGKIIDKQRLSSGKETIQPVVLIKNPQQALALMRYSGTSINRVFAAATEDAGQHWSATIKLPLANPDAAISGVVLPDGKMLVVLNDIEQGRDALSLVMSTDGGISWETIYQLEDKRGQPRGVANYLQAAAESARDTEANIADAAAYAKSAQRNKCEEQNCSFEFSYPYLIQARNGDFHLVYTWNRSFIKHVQFNRTWLDRRMQQVAMEKNDAALH